MACERYDELIQQHFDQSLTKEESQELQQHLAQCTRCRVDFALYRSVFSTMEELPEVPEPAGFARDVLAALDREPTVTRVAPAFWSLRAHVWYGVAAAAAVVLVAVGLLGGPAGQGALPQPRLVATLDTGSPVPANEAARVVPAAEQVRVVVEGSPVQVLRSGREAWQDVDGEANLALGDVVRTSGGKAVLYYRDCGRLKLQPSSEVQVLARGVRVRSGGTWIRIHKKGTAFYAETPNAVASVRGTIYTVKVTPDGTAVGVFEGKVLVQAGSAEKPLGEGLMLLPGKGVAVAGTTVGSPTGLPLLAYLENNMLPPDELVSGGTPAVDQGTPTEPRPGTGQTVPGWTDLGGSKQPEAAPGFEQLNH